MCISRKISSIEHVHRPSNLIIDSSILFTLAKFNNWLYNVNLNYLFFLVFQLVI